MTTMIKIASIMSVALVSGCASLDQPRSEERQQISDRCWGYGSDSAGVYLATLIFKPVVCMANDLARGQPQMGSGSVSQHTYITPSGTYSVITSPGLTTVNKTAR